MENKTTRSGIGFCGLLTIAFVVLKLVGIVKWGWLWVLSPMWISFIVCSICVIVYVWLIKR